MTDVLPDLTTAQAASRLGISVETLRRWCRAGKLPYFRTPGGQRRFNEAEIDRFAQAMHVDPENG